MLDGRNDGVSVGNTLEVPVVGVDVGWVVVGKTEGMPVGA